MRYTLIGGLNGVGKSTIYDLLAKGDKAQLGTRINVDEIASKLGHWSDFKVQLVAGKKAVSQIKECLDLGLNFHQETTLSGRSILKTVKDAKEKGFYICLWYVYVDNIDIAKARVLSRVEKGGHGIPEDVIESRSKTSLATLKQLAPLCDELRLYNNTAALTATARITHGKLKILDKNIPANILDCLQYEKGV